MSQHPCLRLRQLISSHAFKVLGLTSFPHLLLAPHSIFFSEIISLWSFYFPQHSIPLTQFPTAKEEKPRQVSSATSADDLLVGVNTDRKGKLCCLSVREGLGKVWRGVGRQLPGLQGRSEPERTSEEDACPPQHFNQPLAEQKEQWV